MEREEFLSLYRHSLAHILAKAVIEIFGHEVQYAIGPQISDGAYYDFVLPRPASPEDFEAIENRMRDILKRKEEWIRKEVSRNEAMDIFKDQKYKLEVIKDLPEDEVISVYYTGDDYVDLCRGPHVENSAELLQTAFKVKAVSAAYWRGDAKNDSMQRIYIYAFPSKDELKKHLAFVKEAEERDHKKLGPELQLFMFHETAPGMPYWLPRGWRMYRALVEYWREIHDRNGYQEISAPVINNKKLWLISGHWAHYQDNMFIVPGTTWTPDADDVMAAKPMNCPNAMNTYARTNHSYKELPIRYNEIDMVHRKEKSGALNGLFRVQAFRQDDDHTFVSIPQIEEEIENIISIADEIYSTFGITYRAELSTRPDDFMGDIGDWNQAESALKRILDKKYGEGGYEINEGDGAFYGPKIDLQIKDAIGREWQCGTVQLDFQLPHNFGLTYQDQNGRMVQPVVIHRAIFGSFERFIGILIENFKGAFPFWLSPYQVGIVPIRVEHNEYALELKRILENIGVRAECDTADKNMNEKIKEYKNLKDPYIIVVGDKEVEERTVSINIRGIKQQLHGVTIEQLTVMCRKMNDEHLIDLITSMEGIE